MPPWWLLLAVIRTPEGELVFYRQEPRGAGSRACPPWRSCISSALVPVGITGSGPGFMSLHPLWGSRGLDCDGSTGQDLHCVRLWALAVSQLPGPAGLLSALSLRARSPCSRPSQEGECAVQLWPWMGPGGLSLLPWVGVEPLPGLRPSAPCCALSP